MKKIKILLVLSIVSMVMFSFKDYEALHFEDSNNSEIELVKEIKVTYNAPISDFDRIHVQRVFQFIYGQFEVRTCLILGDNQEVWVFKEKTEINTSRDASEAAANEPIRPEIKKLLETISFDFNSGLISLCE